MIRLNADDLMRGARTIGGWANSVPQAVVNAINRTALEVRKAEQAEMRSVFDQPTPWILRQVLVQPATLAHPEAIVGPGVVVHTITDSATGAFTTRYEVGSSVWEAILSPHIVGGLRPQKRFEKRLERAGLMPRGWFATPGPHLPLDRYGNPRRGEFTKMLSWLGALEIGNRNPQGRRRNLTQRQSGQYFVALPGRTTLPPGVYLDVGGQKKLMLRYVPQVTYRERLDWFGIGGRVLSEQFERKLRSELRKL